jgi:uncharacterized protein (DUF488 family)
MCKLKRIASEFDLFTVGHSNISIERFIALLQQAGVTAIADVRSVPLSRRFPWFSKNNLAKNLPREAIDYTAMGEVFGGRPRDERLFRDGVADYEAMAQEPRYQDALARLMTDAERSRICLMCAEREPLDCHRCLLVARSLAERGVTVGHILHDGAIEPHAAIERRLIAFAGEGCDLFAHGQRERLAAAYRRRAHAVAYRRKENDAVKAAGVESK